MEVCPSFFYTTSRFSLEIRKDQSNLHESASENEGHASSASLLSISFGVKISILCVQQLDYINQGYQSQQFLIESEL